MAGFALGKWGSSDIGTWIWSLGIGKNVKNQKWEWDLRIAKWDLENKMNWEMGLVTLPSGPSQRYNIMIEN